MRDVEYSRNDGLKTHDFDFVKCDRTGVSFTLDLQSGMPTSRVDTTCRHPGWQADF